MSIVSPDYASTDLASQFRAWNADQPLELPRTGER